MAKRELKPISFNPDIEADKEMLEYIDQLGVAFGTYVKLLIRKDMLRGATKNECSSPALNNETKEIANQLKELVSVLKSGKILFGSVEANSESAATSLESEEVVETDEEREMREKKENAITGILNIPIKKE